MRTTADFLADLHKLRKVDPVAAAIVEVAAEFLERFDALYGPADPQAVDAFRQCADLVRSLDAKIVEAVWAESPGDMVTSPMVPVLAFIADVIEQAAGQ